MNLYLRSLKEDISRNEWESSSSVSSASSAVDAARIKARIAQSEKLLELLGEAKLIYL